MAGGMQGGPGGYGYPAGMPPPMPVRRSSGTNCLIAGLIGCGVLVILVVISFYIIGKKFGGFIQNSVSSQRDCAQSLVGIRTALRDYQTKHNGKYPAKLSDLVPDYLSDRSALTCNGDPATETTYTPPKQDAPEETAVVSFTGPESTMMEVGQSQLSQRVVVRLLKDGRIVSDQMQRTRTQLLAPEAGGVMGGRRGGGSSTNP